MTRMSYTKNCAQCEQPFTKRSGFSISQWERQLYCAHKCWGQSMRLKNDAKRSPLREVFESRFERAGACWEWRGTIDGYGYGVLDHGRKRYRAHVLALRYDGRPVPKGMIACHHCDNTKCVRPSHLYVGTEKTNAIDAMQRDRLIRGERHPLAKLTDDAVREMRRAVGVSAAELARRFGVSRPVAARVIKGTGWGHVK